MHTPIKHSDSPLGSAHVRPPANADPLVDAATVAAALGQAKSSIYRLAKSGAIPSYAAGPRLRGRRFDLAEVKATLKALAQSAVPS